MNANIEQMLRELATTLGVTIEHLWAVTVKQAVISGILDLIVLLVCTFIAFIGVKAIYKNRDKWDQELLIIVITLVAIISVITFLAWVLGFTNIISAIFNPEYRALELFGQILTGK